jgi:3-mercaptopyruvate sulfurtransferase SseA
LARRQVLLQRHQEAVATARTRDDQIIVYANNNHRINTSAAAATLAAHGYRNVRTYPGGLVDWEAAGYVSEAHRGGRRKPSLPTNLAPPVPARPARQRSTLRQRLVRQFTSSKRDDDAHSPADAGPGQAVMSRPTPRANNHTDQPI